MQNAIPVGCGRPTFPHNRIRRGNRYKAQTGKGRQADPFRRKIADGLPQSLPQYRRRSRPTQRARVWRVVGIVTLPSRPEPPRKTRQPS